MASEDERGLTEAVVTCKGNLHDPDFSVRFQEFVDKLKTLLYTKKEEPFKVRKIEPWNSVRVTISIPKEAAQKLRQLAQQGSSVLQQLGILSVQVDGDQVISLTLAGKNNEPQNIVLTEGNAESSSPSTSAAALLSCLVPSQGSSTTTPSPPCPVPQSQFRHPPSFQNYNQQQSGQCAGPSGSISNTSSRDGFRIPNVIAPTGEAIPNLPPSPAPTHPPRPTHGGSFPFASMTHAAHSLQRNETPTTPGASSPSSSSTRSSPTFSLPPNSSGASSSNNNPKSTNISTSSSPPVLQPVHVQGQSQTVLLTQRSDPTRFVYNSNSGSTFSSNNAISQASPSSSSSSSPSQSLQLQFVNVNTPPSPYFTQQQQQQQSSAQFRPQVQGQQYASTSRDNMTNLLLPGDKHGSSPLLVNLLQHGDSGSSSSSPTSNPGTPSPHQSQSDNSRSMPPPPLSLSMSLESPKVKRYQQLQQQRKMKRGLSLDTQPALSPSSMAGMSPRHSMLSHSEPASPLNESNSHDALNPEHRTVNFVSPATPDPRAQGQVQGRSLSNPQIFQQQQGNMRVVNPAQFAAIRHQQQQQQLQQQQHQQQLQQQQHQLQLQQQQDALQQQQIQGQPQHQQTQLQQQQILQQQARLQQQQHITQQQQPQLQQQHMLQQQQMLQPQQPQQQQLLQQLQSQQQQMLQQQHPQQQQMLQQQSQQQQMLQQQQSQQQQMLQQQQPQQQQMLQQQQPQQPQQQQMLQQQPQQPQQQQMLQQQQMMQQQQHLLQQRQLQQQAHLQQQQRLQQQPQQIQQVQQSQLQQQMQQQHRPQYQTQMRSGVQLNQAQTQMHESQLQMQASQHQNQFPAQLQQQNLPHALLNGPNPPSHPQQQQFFQGLDNMGSLKAAQLSQSNQLQQQHSSQLQQQPNQLQQQPNQLQQSGLRQQHAMDSSSQLQQQFNELHESLQQHLNLQQQQSNQLQQQPNQPQQQLSHTQQPQQVILQYQQLPQSQTHQFAQPSHEMTPKSNMTTLNVNQIASQNSQTQGQARFIPINATSTASTASSMSTGARTLPVESSSGTGSNSTTKPTFVTPTAPPPRLISSMQRAIMNCQEDDDPKPSPSHHRRPSGKGETSFSPKSPSTGKPKLFLINPLTGHLEPMPNESSSESEEDEDGDYVGKGKGKGPRGKHRPKAAKVRSGKGKPMPVSIGKSSSFDSASNISRMTPQYQQNQAPGSAQAMSPASHPNEIAAEKIKLRLKLEKNDPAYKVDVSFVKKSEQSSISTGLHTTSMQPGYSTPTSSSASASFPQGAYGGTMDQPRVPPLHISLRGRNAAVVVSPRRDEMPSELNPIGVNSMNAKPNLSQMMIPPPNASQATNYTPKLNANSNFVTSNSNIVVGRVKQSASAKSRAGKGTRPKKQNSMPGPETEFDGFTPGKGKQKSGSFGGEPTLGAKASAGVSGSNATDVISKTSFDKGRSAGFNPDLNQVLPNPKPKKKSRKKPDSAQNKPGSSEGGETPRSDAKDRVNNISKDSHSTPVISKPYPGLDSVFDEICSQAAAFESESESKKNVIVIPSESTALQTPQLKTNPMPVVQTKTEGYATSDSKMNTVVASSEASQLPLLPSKTVTPSHMDIYTPPTYVQAESVKGSAGAIEETIDSVLESAKISDLLDIDKSLVGIPVHPIPATISELEILKIQETPLPIESREVVELDPAFKPCLSNIDGQSLKQDEFDLAKVQETLNRLGGVEIEVRRVVTEAPTTSDEPQSRLRSSVFDKPSVELELCSATITEVLNEHVSEPVISTPTLPSPPNITAEDLVGNGNGNTGIPGEDSGIDSMDALSEKSPNQGESPARKELDSDKPTDVSLYTVKPLEPEPVKPVHIPETAPEHLAPISVESLPEVITEDKIESKEVEISEPQADKLPEKIEEPVQPDNIEAVKLDELLRDEPENMDIDLEESINDQNSHTKSDEAEVVHRESPIPTGPAAEEILGAALQTFPTTVEDIELDKIEPDAAVLEEIEQDSAAVEPIEAEASASEVFEHETIVSEDTKPEPAITDSIEHKESLPEELESSLSSPNITEAVERDAKAYAASVAEADTNIHDLPHPVESLNEDPTEAETDTDSVDEAPEIQETATEVPEILKSISLVQELADDLELGSQKMELEAESVVKVIPPEKKEIETLISVVPIIQESISVEAAAEPEVELVQATETPAAPAEEKVEVEDLAIPSPVIVSPEPLEEASIVEEPVSAVVRPDEEAEIVSVTVPEEIPATETNPALCSSEAVIPDKSDPIEETPRTEDWPEITPCAATHSEIKAEEVHADVPEIVEKPEPVPGVPDVEESAESTEPVPKVPAPTIPELEEPEPELIVQKATPPTPEEHVEPELPILKPSVIEAKIISELEEVNLPVQPVTVQPPKRSPSLVQLKPIPNLNPIVISPAEIQKPATAIPVSILPRFDAQSPTKARPQLVVHPSQASSLPNLVRPRVVDSRLVRGIHPMPLEVNNLPKVHTKQEEVGGQGQGGNNAGSRRLEAIISALGRSNQNDAHSHHTPNILDHQGKLINFSRAPRMPNVIRVSNATAATLLASGTAKLPQQNAPALISIPSGSVGRTIGATPGTPTMITIPASISHQLHAQHQQHSQSITVLPSGHKVVPIKLVTVPKTSGGASGLNTAPRSSPTILETVNLSRPSSPQISLSQTMTLPIQSAPLNLSSVGGNLTLVPITTNHGQKVLVSSQMKMQGNMLQSMMLMNQNSTHSKQPATFRVVRPGGGFTDFKREPSGHLILAHHQEPIGQVDGVVGPVSVPVTVIPQPMASPSQSQSQPVEAPIPSPCPVDGEDSEDETLDQSTFDGSDEELADIIHDEQDLVEVLAAAEQESIAHNGLVTVNHVEEANVPNGRASRSSNPPSAEVPDSPIQLRRCQSPRFTYSNRAVLHSDSSTQSRSPSPNDIHGEDQEIIDTFSKSPETLQDEDGDEKSELGDHTYVAGNSRGLEKSDSLEELSIEIPEPDLVTEEDKKPARSTRSNTRIVSPDITAFTPSRGDTPKPLQPPQKFTAKVDPLVLRNSPKPSPSGSIKSLSPNVTGQSSSSARSSPVPNSSLAQNSTSGATLSQTNSKSRMNKRKRQESDSSSTSKDENIEEKIELIDLNSRPGKRRCSENAAELIKACIGMDDTPKRNTLLIKRLEEANKIKEAKAKKAMLAAVEETEDEMEPIELLLRGKGGRSSRGSSEDRSSSRGSSINRHVLPGSRAATKDEDHKDVKSTGRATNRNAQSKEDTNSKARTNSEAETPKLNSNSVKKNAEKSKALKSNKANSAKKKTPISSAKIRVNAKKEATGGGSGSEKHGTPTTSPENENSRRKTRSSAAVGTSEADSTAIKRRRISKDLKS